MLFDKDIPPLFDKSYLLLLPLSIFVIIDLSQSCCICSWLKTSLKEEVSFSRSLLPPYFSNYFFLNSAFILFLYFYCFLGFV